MRFNTHIVICLALALLCGHAQGQGMEDEEISFNFTALSLYSDTRTQVNPKAIDLENTTFAYASGGKPIDIKLPPLNQSGPYHYQGPSPMRIYRKQDGRYELLASLPVNSSIRDGLLILDCPLSQANMVKPILIDASLRTLTNGEAMFLNATEFPTICLLGESKVAIPARSQITAKLNTGSKKMTLVKLAFFDPQKENWKRLYSTAYNLSEDMRLIIFLANSGYERSPISVNIIRLDALTSVENPPPDTTDDESA